MNFIAWIILGLIAGWLASAVVKPAGGTSLGMDLILGVVGALVGGFIMNLFGAPGVTGFNIYSIIVAAVGAIVLIWLGRALRGV